MAIKLIRSPSNLGYDCKRKRNLKVGDVVRFNVQDKPKGSFIKEIGIIYRDSHNEDFRVCTKTRNIYKRNCYNVEFISKEPNPIVPI